MSNHEHPTNPPAHPCLNISSTAQTPPMPRPCPAHKNKRNEKAVKFSVPLPKVGGIAEEEIVQSREGARRQPRKAGNA